MNALVWMRLLVYVRSYVALAPVLAALAVYGMIYASPSPAGEAFGMSALTLLALHAWQTKLLLDSEPDTQRQLARVTVGYRREVGAGLIAAIVAGLAWIPLLVGLPLLAGSATTSHGMIASAVAIGAWSHLLVIAPAIAVGAWSSRAITGHVGRGILALAAGLTAVLLLGLQSSALSWLAPPLSAMAHLAASRVTLGTGVVLAALQAGLWAIAVLGGYTWLRRKRA